MIREISKEAPWNVILFSTTDKIDNQTMTQRKHLLEIVTIQMDEVHTQIFLITSKTQVFIHHKQELLGDMDLI